VARASKKKLTGRRERQYNRRLEAGALFEQGKTRAEVAQFLGVSWKAAHGWFKDWEQGGIDSLASKGKPGPASKFTEEDLRILREHLVKGAVAHGYSNELWTLRRIGALLTELFGKKTSASEVWRLLRSMRWSPQKPVRQARERDQAKVDKWKDETWPELCAKAQREERTIVFVDECGFSQKSTAKKTWAPEGQTPIIEMNFNWDKLSVIGGISLKNIYFQMHEESIKSEEVIGFLGHLQRYIQGNLLVIWDGLPAHRSKKVAEFLQKTNGRVWVERLPAYAPELNPIEYLWGNVKGSDLANYSPKELWELSKAAREALFKKRRRPKLLQAFWIQTKLDLEHITA
jgi:transposase